MEMKQIQFETIFWTFSGSSTLLEEGRGLNIMYSFKTVNQASKVKYEAKSPIF